MTQQAAEARRAYRRAWAKANPDKVRAAQERYWAKKAALAAEQAAERADQNGPETAKTAGT